jgi:NAD(P)-dependent dehydrogenase (short-subunit alcohol dehydrogenase family)
MQISESVFFVTGGGSGPVKPPYACCTPAARRGDRRRCGRVGAALATSLGDKARFVRTDVTTRPKARLVETAQRHFGGTGLVNCAASDLRNAWSAGSALAHQFHPLHTDRLIGSFNMIRLAAQTMSTATRGRGGNAVIVNTASIAPSKARSARPLFSLRPASSATLPIARELAQWHPRSYHRPDCS